MTCLNGLNVISRGMRGKEVVGKTRLGRHYAVLAVRDRKSDPVRGLLFGKGAKRIFDQSRSRDVCSCRGWGETDLSVLTREKINKCSCCKDQGE